MADFTTPASDAGFARESAFPVKPAIALGVSGAGRLVVLRTQRIGISAVIFAVRRGLRLAARQSRNVEQKAERRWQASSCWPPLSPPLRNSTPLRSLFMVLALGIGLLLTTNRRAAWSRRARRGACDLYLVGPFRFFRDAVGAFNLPALKSGFAVWFIPVFLGGIFLFLLVSANPLLEKWIGLINPGNTAAYVSLSTVVVLGHGAVDRLALYPCPVARQARGGERAWPRRSHRRRKRGRTE